MENTNPEKETEGVADRKKTPPSNDCCPICFGDFTVPCRSLCDHWFCAKCILDFWHYTLALKPSKCPMCCREIKRLIPEASLQSRQEVEITEILQKIEQYNRLYGEGDHGIFQKMQELPILLKRFLQDMMDSDRERFVLPIVRGIAMLLGLVSAFIAYKFFSMNALQIFRWNRTFEHFAVTLVYILQMIGNLVRRRRLQRLRRALLNDN